MDQTIILATHNFGKLREFSQILADYPFTMVSQTDLNIPSIAETGLTFVENALIKARHAAALAHLPALADDSGLEVDYLNGEPGIYSARYAEDPKNNIDKLLQALHDVPSEKRTARFHCVLVLMRHEHDPTPLICQGTWEGLILTQRQGDYGFGYDPIFWVPSHECSAAELSPEIKNAISHRAQALQQLKCHLDRM
ncbi:MAG: RdgB/HAM1 family non-canonical purine NTP pyrophosphatase [Legionellales bacterium]|nr:RdgB/HAM1 family non-canonical purine NTP pyrophosphatase [Legionellales bacterium]